MNLKTVKEGKTEMTPLFDEISRDESSYQNIFVIAYDRDVSAETGSAVDSIVKTSCGLNNDEGLGYYQGVSCLPKGSVIIDFDFSKEARVCSYFELAKLSEYEISELSKRDLIAVTPIADIRNSAANSIAELNDTEVSLLAKVTRERFLKISGSKRGSIGCYKLVDLVRDIKVLKN